MRCLAGIINDVLLASLVWGFGKFGKADLIFRAIRKSQRGKQAKAKPFGRYQVSARDVIVAVYGKSGTNWTMQIAHQLLHHGESRLRPHTFRSRVAGCNAVSSSAALRDSA